MCQYCEDLFTGFVGMDLGTIEIKVNKVPLFKISTYLNDHKNCVYLSSDLASGNGISAKEYKGFEIHYCPICGRKFKEE